MERGTLPHPSESERFAPDLWSDVEQTPREQLLIRLIVGQTIGVAFLAVLTAIVGLLLPESGLLALMPLAVIALFVGLLSYRLARRGQVRRAGHIFLMGTTLAITVNVFIRGYQDASALYYLWPILAAMTLLEVRDGILVLGASVAAYLSLMAAERLGYHTPALPYDPQREALLTVNSVMLMFFLLTFLVRRVRLNLDDALQQIRQVAQGWRELNETLERRVEERTRGLRVAAEVSRATTAVLDPDDLLRQTVDLVRERFGLYYVGLFLLDEEQQFAVLRAGTGEAGKRMLEQAHRLAVGGESMIGACVASGQARIALDVGEEAVRFDNPLLPDTRSEMALPLRSRGRVIGAMSVQSTAESAFDEADIVIMQTMADQVAVAIDNARLFAATQVALAEMETTHQRYLGQAWTRYLRVARDNRYEARQPGVAPLDEHEVMDEAREALERRRPTVLDGGDDGHSALVAPIALRGVTIGVLGLHDERNPREWTDDEIALVEAIAERLALAAENLRLLDETQRRAARERLTADITARLRETLDVDAVLQAAAREIGQSLDFAEVEVRIGGIDGESG